MKKQGLKGIPREFVADKLIFIFQGKKAVINVSVKTWVTLFENIVPMMKKIKIGGIEIGAPKIIHFFSILCLYFISKHDSGFLFLFFF